MKARQLKKLAIALALGTGVSAPVSTSMAASWMEDYFNSAGAGMNVTAPNYYKAQTQTTYSLGGFSYRAPQRSTQLFSFSPPGYKAGCGGIDAWLGAYGFVNKDAFVNMLRNIGQNAVGYFFQLALKTMAPEIDETLSKLSKTMQDLNSMQLNSCQALKTHFSSDVDTRGMDFNQRAQVFGSSITGGFESMFNARDATDGNAAEAQKAMTDACTANTALCLDASGQPYLPEDVNIAYNAMLNTSAYSQEEMELFQSLLGTVVFRKNNSDLKGPFSVSYFEPTLHWKDFLGEKDFYGGKPLNIRQCPGTGAGCLYDDSSTAVLVPVRGWVAIVNEMLLMVRDKIVTRSYITDSRTIQLLAMSSQPIYQLIAESISAGRGSLVVTNNIISSLTELVAIELAYHQVSDISREMGDSIAKFRTRAVKADSDALDTLATYMRVVQDQADQDYNAEMAKAAGKMQNYVTMMQLQRQLYNGLGPRLSSNLEFGKKH